MREVFSLWPTTTDPGDGIGPDGLPLWAMRPGGPTRRPRWTRNDGLATALALAVIVSLALIVPADAAGTIVATLLALAAISLTVVGLLIHRRTVAQLDLQLEESRQWNNILFERTGFALWREDWSAARDEVLRLLRSGVHDMQAHFAANPDALRAIRASVIIKDVNQIGVLRAGAQRKEDLLGSLDVILPDTDQTFVQWLVAFARGDVLYRSETHLVSVDGNPVHTLFAAGLPTDMHGFENILVNDLDITEYKNTQARLAQAEIELARSARVTTMGALSASIAHEVNSPLSAILSNAEASLRWLHRDDPNLSEAIAALQNVVEASVRARAVVERTRAYLANTPSTLEPQNIVKLVQDALQLIDRELVELGVSIHIDAIDGLPAVMADAVNIQQVMVNLTLNAAQAMHGKDAPRDVTIVVREVENKVRVDVTDHGPGIDAATMKSIFEPFFSTKLGSMGMGLTICRTCISAHGGRLWVTSSVGEGSTFHFDLPLAEADIG